MRRVFGLLLVLAIVFGVDVCVHSTPWQRQAFKEAVERSATYRAVDGAVPDDWFETWKEQWRELQSPYPDSSVAADP